jgi:hypothetical protein
MAEPKITQAAIGLLETVSKAPRKPWHLSAGPATKATAALGPIAHWRLNEFTGPIATDSSPHQHHAAYEGGVAYYLDGPHAAQFCGGEVNRAPHFVGGRLASEFTQLGEDYTLSLWIWNGMPVDGRDFCGWFYSRDHNHGVSAFGEHLGIGGKSGNTGKLVFQVGEVQFAGKTELPRWTWQHIALVRKGGKVLVYLNGALDLEAMAPVVNIPALFLGGRSDNTDNWEGRLDEVAVFGKALSSEEIAKLSLR